MLFFEDSLKDIKKELKEAGGDLSFVKEWQKSFDKVKKQSQSLESSYVQAKKELNEVSVCLQQMEQVLIASKGSVTDPELPRKLMEFSKKLKVYQNSFNQEFLIGKADKDFHLTYGTLLTLCTKPLKKQKDVLILQSEVENLLAVTKEALEKQWPDFRALAFFYLGHTDGELIDLPHQDKVNLINRSYEEAFVKPIWKVLSESLGEARAKQILEVEVWN